MSYSYATKDELFIYDPRDGDIIISYDKREAFKPNKIIGFTENPLIKFWNEETTTLDMEHYKVLEKLDAL